MSETKTVYAAILDYLKGRPYSKKFGISLALKDKYPQKEIDDALDSLVKAARVYQVRMSGSDKHYMVYSLSKEADQIVRKAGARFSDVRAVREGGCTWHVPAGFSSVAALKAFRKKLGLPS